MPSPQYPFSYAFLFGSLILVALLQKTAAAGSATNLKSLIISTCHYQNKKNVRTISYFVLFLAFAFICTSDTVVTIRTPLSSIFANNVYQLRLERMDAQGSEALILTARIPGQGDCFFQVDTGYAGAPVLSTTYLASNVPSGASFLHTMDSIRAQKTSAQLDAAVKRHLRASRCRAFTSGCSMRLMGIGSTTEQQADMMLCTPILFLKAKAGKEYSSPRASPTSATAFADVLVTNPLRASCHILTSDYLFQVSPCCLRMRDGEFETNISMLRLGRIMAGGFSMTPIRLSGGAIVIPLLFENQVFNCTMDTGACGPICLSSAALPRLNKYRRTGTSVQQYGINGEKITSSVLSADVSFLGAEIKDVAVFANDSPVDHVDGYVGLGFLRAFDIVITDSFVAFRASGLHPTKAVAYATL